MIARVTPYVGEGRRVPDMVGVLLEGEEREREYVPRWQLVEAQLEVERLQSIIRGEHGDDWCVVDVNGEALD